YCFNHLMVKKYRGDLDCSFADLNYIRHHSVDQMMDEIRYLENNYKNISMYILDDDLFTFRKKYVLEFCEAYKKVSQIPFVVNGHVGFWDEERAAALSEAGCSIVKFGVESGSEKIRRQVMNRQTSNKKIIEAVNIVGKYGMHSSCFLMIGLPHETEEDVMDTIRLMADSRPGRFRWTFFYPFPGTQAYTIADEGGFINYDKFHSFTNFTDDSCLEFGAEQDLLLRKIGRIMPWFVNAHSGRECSAFYMDKVQWLLAMDEGEWEKHAPTLLDLDKEYSAKFAAEGKPHFAVKYNRFMGVDSDYFLNE
ncbi:MAG: radical SAM protein, partial [Proteobacteria bacterium]|nr:radical SAM protein [Pseudomonadota bacterium]